MNVINSNLEVTKKIIEFILNLDLRHKHSLIAIGGPGGTGKSSLAKNICRELDNSQVLELDHYKTAREDRSKDNIFGAHPKANRFELIVRHLHQVKQGISINTPIYDTKAGKALSSKEFNPTEYTIIDGEISTYPEIINLMDFTIFVDSHWKTQLNTRITRDIEIRGYTPEKAITTFLHSNLKEFKAFGEKTKELCHCHIFCNSDYNLTIEKIGINQ